MERWSVREAALRECQRRLISYLQLPRSTELPPENPLGGRDRINQKSFRPTRMLQRCFGSASSVGD
jgi:hypothetical protein